MYSQKFKDWAKSKGMFREFDGFNSEASNLPLFWEAWQAAESAERERIMSAINEIADDHDDQAEAAGMRMVIDAIDA